MLVLSIVLIVSLIIPQRPPEITTTMSNGKPLTATEEIRAIEETKGVKIFKIQGIERWFATPDDTCTWIAHILKVSGSSSEAIDVLLERLPRAFQAVMNRHPRMRVTTVTIGRDPYYGKVNPQVTLEQASQQVKVLEASELGANYWISYVQQVVNGQLERTREFPYKLTAFVDIDPKIVRLILFSDHGMSDGMSGTIVLSDILEVASKLDSEAQTNLEEFPLRPSIYSLLHPPTIWSWIIDPLVGLLVPWFLPSILNNADLLPFPKHPEVKTVTYPFPQNPTFMFYDEGTKDNLKAGLAACKSQNVTMHGALLICLILAYNIAADKDCLNKDPQKPLKIMLDLDFNMRPRVKNPFPEAPVGLNIFIDTLHMLKSKGIGKTAKFWDAARLAKRETDKMIENLDPVLLIFSEQASLTDNIQKLLKIEKPGMSDVNVSNLGKWKYATKHQVEGGKQHTGLTWNVESLHFNNSLPNIGPASIVFFASIDYMTYTFASKYEDETSRRLLKLVKESCEAIGTIDPSDTLESFGKRVLVPLCD